MLYCICFIPKNLEEQELCFIADHYTILKAGSSLLVFQLSNSSTKVCTWNKKLLVQNENKQLIPLCIMEKIEPILLTNNLNNFSNSYSKFEIFL